jgi:hypothetical protein
MAFVIMTLVALWRHESHDHEREDGAPVGTGGP